VPILIDGHNLIGKLSRLSLCDPGDEEALVRLLRFYQAHTGKAITVVFDPGGAFVLPKVYHLSGIEVIFAPHGSSADAAIVRRVRHSREPCGWLVVTSDRALAKMVAREGARIRSAEDFAVELDTSRNTTPEWKEIPPSAEDIESWLALFEPQG
jgi:predicted RNA-binding protein with PIN domain